MQSYKKTLTIMVLAVAVFTTGCEKRLFPGVPRYLREPAPSSRVGRDTASLPPEVISARKLYVTALCGDDAVLFADGIEIARAAADPDPERHRARQGHLWTDAIQGKETVVFRDGEEWLSFPGEELLRGFLIRDGKLHTLGQRPGNDGICYRVDGKEVFSAPSGRIVGNALSREWDAGAFCADSSGVYYTYGIPFVHSGSTTWEYHIMKGPDTFLVIPDDASGTVLDIRILDGKVYRAERTVSLLKLVCGDDILAAHQLNQRESLSDVALVPLNGKMYLRGVSNYSRYNFSEAWLIGPGRAEKFQEYNRYSSPFLFRKNSVKVFGTTLSSHLLRLGINNKILSLDYGLYSFRTPLCLNVFDTTFVAILSDSTSTNHIVLTDTLSTPLRFNGVPTSIRIE